jgi:parvulin-like peptidyl-prolyl isomerase
MSAFLTVNGHEISVSQAMRQALLDGSASPFLTALVDRELVRQYAATEGLTVSDEELQRAADEMRYDRGLQDGARAMAWLGAHGQTIESMQDQIEAFLLRNKAIASIAARDVESYYHSHVGGLEYVVLFSIRAATEADALALRARIDAGEPFPVVAATASRDPTTSTSGGLVGRVRRAELSPEIAEVAFTAEPGQVVGPMPTDKGYNLLLVADRRIPSFDDEAVGIRLWLFDALIARLRAAADIRYPSLDAPPDRGGFD